MTAKWGKHPDHNRWHIVRGGKALCGQLLNIPAWHPVPPRRLRTGVIDCAHCVAAHNAKLKGK